MAPELERRSPLATFVGFMLFLLVAVGSGCILTLLLSVGPGAERAWADMGVSLPIGSQGALSLSRLVAGAYLPVMAVTVVLHALLLGFCTWAGYSPGRVLWAVLVAAIVASFQILALLWLGIAFTFPFLR